MKKYIPILQKSQMFRGIGEEKLSSMLVCLDAKMRRFQKGEFILRRGETLSTIPILAEGELLIQKDDYWGKCSILGHIAPGEMFGEAYATFRNPPLLNDVIAVNDSTVLFFDVNKILTTCSSACHFHNAVVKNLFCAISEKNRNLVQKISLLSKPTTREKLLSYLSEESKKCNSSTFTIPFNRQQLADYLSVERSAMSAQLCKLRDEGILEFQKNRFTLL